MCGEGSLCSSLNPAVSSPPKRLSTALLVPAANTEAPTLACRGPSPLHKVGWESI